MRPDKRKRNRGRNVEKSEGSGIQENKNDGKNDSKAEDKQSKPEEIEKPDQKAVSKEGPATKDESENQPAPALRRETDALKETKKFSKRQIFSNWEKYNEPIIPEEEEVEAHNDFGLLIQRNFSGDEHFKFKFERQWESESCSINQDLFTLNLERLSAGLDCIPYFKRLNLPTYFFSKDELQRMENLATKQEKRYEKLLKGEADNKAEHLITSLLGKLKENTDEQVVDKTNTNSETKNQEVDFMDMGEFLIKDNKINAEGELIVNQISENICDENQLNERMISENPLSDINLHESKEIKNQVSKNEVNENEKGEVKLNSSEVWESEIDKNENKGKECATDKKKTSEYSVLNNTNIQAESQDLIRNTKTIGKDTRTENSVESTNTRIVGKDIQREKSIKSNVSMKTSSKESVAKKDKTGGVSEVTLSPKNKDFKSKNASKIKGLGEEEEVLDSLLSLKEPAVSTFDISKNKVEDEDNEADNLLTDVSSIVIHEKKENLEEWLDGMLDD